MSKLKVLIFALLIFASGRLSAQEIQLIVSNPQPRVGQHFTVSFDMSFFNDFFSKALEGKLHVEEVSHFEKTYSRSLMATQAGNYDIGPFSFDFNGQTYTTNKVSITVIEPLATGEGVWLRYVKTDKEDLLIIEQKKKVNNQSSAGSFSSQATNEFASLIESSVEGLKLTKGLETKSQIPDGKGFAFRNSMNYYMQIYKIERSEGYKGSTVISRQNFRNLPETVTFSPLTIN